MCINADNQIYIYPLFALTPAIEEDIFHCIRQSVACLYDVLSICKRFTFGRQTSFRAVSKAQIIIMSLNYLNALRAVIEVSGGF